MNLQNKVLAAIVLVIAVVAGSWSFLEFSQQKNQFEIEKLRIEAGAKNTTATISNTAEVQISDSSKIEQDSLVKSQINKEVVDLESLAKQQQLKMAQDQLEQNCQLGAFKFHERYKIPGYGWHAWWNQRLKTCFIETTGWDTELIGHWNQMIHDPINDVSYGSLTLYNKAVAEGTQSKNSDPFINGVISTCVKAKGVKCKDLRDWSSYATSLEK